MNETYSNWLLVHEENFVNDRMGSTTLEQSIEEMPIASKGIVVRSRKGEVRQKADVGTVEKDRAANENCSQINETSLEFRLNYLIRQ